MSQSFTRLPALGLAAMIICACSVAGSAIAAAVSRGIALAFEVLARPARFLQDVLAAPVTAGPALSYDGPPVHHLRHEAGVSRLSAARNT